MNREYRGPGFPSHCLRSLLKVLRHNLAAYCRVSLWFTSSRLREGLPRRNKKPRCVVRRGDNKIDRWMAVSHRVLKVKGSTSRGFLILILVVLDVVNGRLIQTRVNRN